MIADFGPRLGAMEERLIAAYGINTVAPDDLSFTYSGLLPSIDDTRDLLPDLGPLTFQGGFPADTTLILQDEAGERALLLTGRWIVDYARKVELVKEYEALHASYEQYVDLQQKVIDEHETVLELEAQENRLLHEVAERERERAEAYRGLADARRGGVLDRFLRKIAFPAGIAIGLAVGVAIN